MKVIEEAPENGLDKLLKQVYTIDKVIALLDDYILLYAPYGAYDLLTETYSEPTGEHNYNKKKKMRLAEERKKLVKQVVEYFDEDVTADTTGYNYD